MNERFKAVASGCAVLAAASGAFATEIWQTEAEFLTQIMPDYYLETFDLPGGGTLFLGPSVDFGPVNGYSYNMFTTDELYLWGMDYSGLNSDTIGTNGPNAPVTITFTGAPVTAVGGYFFLTDINFLPIPGGFITLELDDGTTEVVNDPYQEDFRGFTSDVPIVSLTMTPGHNTGADTYVTIDDVYVGTAAAGCPADINGDGVVDVLDLLEVLGQWGAAGGPADINGDGIVDVLDLLEVLAAWGPCNPIGACCIWPGPTCQDLTQVDCTMAGGYDWAEGEECATYQCPDPPLGACCFYPSGDCQDLNTYDCTAAGGDWQGAGTNCATTTCPTAPQGDVIGNAIPVPLPLPYNTDGDTTSYADDYDEICPYSGSLSNDVVYAYTADFTGTITIDLCGMSAYDTKLYVYDNPNPTTYYACNDDFCVSGAGQSFVSQLSGVVVNSGTTYYIVIDGYGSNNGFYTLDITTP